MVAFLFSIAFQSEISPRWSLDAIAFGRRLAALSGGFAGRLTLTCALPRTLCLPLPEPSCN